MAEAALLLSLPEAAAERDAREKLALWDGRADTTAPLTDRQTDSVLALKAAAEALPVPAEVRRRREPGWVSSVGASADARPADPRPGSLPPFPGAGTAPVGEAAPLPGLSGLSLPGTAGAAPRRGPVGRELCPGCPWGHRARVLPPTLSRKESAANPKCFAFRTASCWCLFATLMNNPASFFPRDAWGRPELVRGDSFHSSHVDLLSSRIKCRSCLYLTYSRAIKMFFFGS